MLLSTILDLPESKGNTAFPCPGFFVGIVWRYTAWMSGRRRTHRTGRYLGAATLQQWFVQLTNVFFFLYGHCTVAFRSPRLPFWRTEARAHFSVSSGVRPLVTMLEGRVKLHLSCFVWLCYGHVVTATFLWGCCWYYPWFEISFSSCYSDVL